MRGIFFEEETAREVAAQLIRSGWNAQVEVERLAGEDDDEDHQWAVRTDAPAVQFELLIDNHDGWLDDGQVPAPGPGVGPGADLGSGPDAGSGTAAAPMELPLAPRRIKRPSV
ncbi:hypothetical protein [Nocardioides daejeonensis]|uniref:hypothetical protein n=1 Tax=Nocardioides daejeonensis TaxID=1046556 RepID=UPI00194F8C45|nr:hypothetical protein [Nocardioides daejeonensis]